MCSETFLRLPEEKRNRFLEAAWEEFTRVNLADASINKIIQKAGIPRGSFYQYFASKDDLFFYLRQTVLEYLVEEYCKYMRDSEGDIFQTQITCLDQIAALGSSADEQFDRCLRILRLNPGLLPQVAMEGKLMCVLFDRVQGIIDTSALRRQDPEFVAHTFGLTLVSLAIAVVASLEKPDQADTFRQTFLTQLDIIKYGTLAEPCQKNA